MSPILLATLNARYSHASLGLRYLLANMGELRRHTRLLEFTIKQRPVDIVEQLLAESPQIIGLGVYIWNARETAEVVALLRLLAPEVTLVLGGPEVSFETEQQTLCREADYVIRGQGDLAFAALCRQLLRDEPPGARVIDATPPALDALALPYDEYSDEDIAQRVVYVEASRGCPFKCEFCLSALDRTALPFDLDRFLAAMQGLYRRGLRRFKFVDRTFNLKVASCLRILDFFLQRLDESLFLHFELVPDHLPEALKEKIQAFPPGTLQFEIGVQSFTPEVQARIHRKQDHAKTEANLRWLRTHSHAHLHADLIIGLPGEDLASFAAGFDRLVALAPHEIQVGLLKRLRGAPIDRHSTAYAMRYQHAAPYTLLANDRIDFATMQRLARFARYWDLIANSGRFGSTLPLILAEAPFARFLQLSDWLYAETGQTHRIQLPRLFTLLYQALGEALTADPAAAEAALIADYARNGLKGTPRLTGRNRERAMAEPGGASKRQARHQPSPE